MHSRVQHNSWLRNGLSGLQKQNLGTHYLTREPGKCHVLFAPKTQWIKKRFEVCNFVIWIANLAKFAFVSPKTRKLDKGVQDWEKKNPYLDLATLEAKQDIVLDLVEYLRYCNNALEPDVLRQVLDLVISVISVIRPLIGAYYSLFPLPMSMQSIAVNKYLETTHKGKVASWINHKKAIKFIDQSSIKMNWGKLLFLNSLTGRIITCTILAEL